VLGLSPPASRLFPYADQAIRHFLAEVSNVVDLLALGETALERCQK